MRSKITFFKNNIIILMFILFLTAPNISAQLVTNGSFEETEPGSVTDSLTGLDGWLLQLSDGAEADFQVVADTAQEGNHSLKVLPTTMGANQWSIQVVADSIPVTPGETYTYSIWAKAETGGAQVNFTVGNYSYSEYEVIRPATLTTEWKQFTLEFTVTDNETVIRAPIHFNYDSNQNNKIYIDNLVIEKVFNPGDLLKPVIVEAESGEVGSDFNITQTDSISYVSIQTNSSAFNPESRARMISFDVTFPDSGTYDLFARVRVGSGTFDDDSFFYGRGFGEKDSSADSSWIFVNGLASAGFSGPNDVVREAGGLGELVWKWINLSRNNYQGDTSLTFTVDKESLNQIFQIGAREDGLDIDKIAFGKSYLYFTVNNLDNGEAGTPEPPGEVWDGPPLASNQPKFVGNIYSSAQTDNFTAYWNEVIPENAGKWGSVEASRDNMNWNGLDAAYKLAKDNGFPFNFHVLLWGQQQPSWINNLSPDDQLAEIREWFEAVAERYPDIDYLQVVNEPLNGHNPPDGNNGRANYKEALGGNGDTGWDWVVNAFKMAREIFPADTKLMLNDFNIISSTSSTATYLNLIRLLKSENLIDVIGEQGHAFTTTAPVSVMKRNLDSLATTGLPIQITEFDIDGPSDAVQLQSYKRIFPVLYEHPKVEGITLWGWRRGLWRDEQGAYIINQDGSERPALEWLRNYLDTLNVEPVGVKDIKEVPAEYSLSNNYPNPFNPATNIEYSITKTSKVTLTIYDVLGREVKTLVNEVKSPGNYTVKFNAQNLSSGIYLYRLRADGFVKTKKLILQK